MRKAVLLSIRPKWVELIARGEKTVEVRKTRPRIDTSFKVYMYMTRLPWLFDMLRTLGMHKMADVLLRGFGKIVGEFICDRIQTIYYDSDVRYGIAFPNEYCNGIATDTCLSLQEIEEYLTGKDGAGWRISRLMMYKEPKSMSEFGINRPPQSWCYVEELT